MGDKDKVYVNIDNGKITVGFIVISKQEDGIVSSHIPGFDIWYSSPTVEIAQERGKAMIHNFFAFWIGKQGWKKFILQIHKLGFRAKMHDLKLKNLLNRRPEKADFQANENIESDFGESSILTSLTSELELAS